MELNEFAQETQKAVQAELLGNLALHSALSVENRLITPDEMWSLLCKAALAEYSTLLSQGTPASITEARQRTLTLVAREVFSESWPPPSFVSLLLGVTETRAIALLDALKARPATGISHLDPLVRREFATLVRETIDHDVRTRYVATLAREQARDLNRMLTRRSPSLPPIVKAKGRGGQYEIDYRCFALVAIEYDIRDLRLPVDFLAKVTEIVDDLSGEVRLTKRLLTELDRSLDEQGLPRTEVRLAGLWKTAVSTIDSLSGELLHRPLVSGRSATFMSTDKFRDLCRVYRVA